MAFYRLVPSRLPHTQYDEVIFTSPDSGEAKSVSINEPTELSDSEVGMVRELGYSLVEAQSPSENQPAQVVGADVAGMSPIVETNAETGEAEVSQEGQQAVQAAAWSGNQPSTSGSGTTS